MISQYFNSGNYNEWEEFVNTKLPNINKIIREEIIPQIDEILISMLGNRSNINKASINVRQKCSQTLDGIYIDIVYNIEDWKVIDAPTKAIESDENTLRDFLTVEGRELISLSIDVASGNLNIQYYIEV